MPKPFFTSRFEREEDYGDTLWSYGTVNVVGDRVYLDSMDITQYLRNFDGQQVAFEFVFGLKSMDKWAERDEKIVPLVEALNSKGIKTLHSCQGHLESRQDGKYDYKYPQVDILTQDVPKLNGLLPADWFFELAPWGDRNVTRLRHIREAMDSVDLDYMQREAFDLAKAIAEK
jgi:hypothetical protein